MYPKGTFEPLGSRLLAVFMVQYLPVQEWLCLASSQIFFILPEFILLFKVPKEAGHSGKAFNSLTWEAEFKANQGYVVRPQLKNKNVRQAVAAHAFNPRIYEAEPGGSL